MHFSVGMDECQILALFLSVGFIFALILISI